MTSARSQRTLLYTTCTDVMYDILRNDSKTFQTEPRFIHDHEIFLIFSLCIPMTGFTDNSSENIILKLGFVAIFVPSSWPCLHPMWASSVTF